LPAAQRRAIPCGDSRARVAPCVRCAGAAGRLRHGPRVAMRKQFCDALVARAKNPDMIFLTGDLGFMALEELQKALGERFINAGVAEQNMISVAAALARQGFQVWAYSIAPFCYARPFEQIRNDITFHGLPVKLVGNGGGYGYGVMGPTHHAI